MSRIEDVLFVDSLARDPSKMTPVQIDSSPIKEPGKLSNPKDEVNKQNTPTSMTLLDFMGWTLEQGEIEVHSESKEDISKDNSDLKTLSKPPQVVTNKKLTYLERLETLGGLRSPTARH